jgi:hypothetical protein
MRLPYPHIYAELPRIPIPRTPVNKGMKREGRRLEFSL